MESDTDTRAKLHKCNHPTMDAARSQTSLRATSMCLVSDLKFKLKLQLKFKFFILNLN